MIVVTGAAGHLGNNLVRRLVGGDEQVRCLLLPAECTLPLAGLDVEVLRGDVRDLAGLMGIVAGARLVYHLASVISIAGAPPRLMAEVNVDGARNVATVCLEAGVGRMVHVSSIHALREPPAGVAFDEGQPFEPAAIRMPYGNSKARGTLAVLEVARQGRGLDVVVACPTGVIGPHDYRPSEMGQLILDYAAGRLPATVRGAYDFVDVRDVADGLIGVAGGGRGGEHYILSGEQISVRQIVALLRELIGERGRCPELPGWMADVAAWASPVYYRLSGGRPRLTRDALETLRSNSLVSHAKATALFGYAPRPLAESLADTVAWFEAAGRLRRG